MTTRDAGTDDLDRDYAGAGFGGRLPFGRRPAVIVVDFVRAYLDPSSPLYAGVESAFESARRVVHAARAARVPVVFTGVRFVPGGVDGGVFYRKVPSLRLFDAGSPMGDYVDGLAPAAGEPLVLKQGASAFFGTSLAPMLTSWGIDTVVVVGVSTSGCVRATAVDACQHGFVPFVVRDAVGDRDPRPHEASLFDLQAKYAEVIGETEAVGRIAASARAAGGDAPGGR